MLPVPTIAIVDDDGGVRDGMSSLARSLGYVAFTYASAEAFLEEDRNADPSCMIADVQMPSMSGIELQAHLNAAGRLFPIIFMTAFPSDAVREKLMSAGGFRFLAKPSTGDEIISSIEAAVAFA